jgi:predicted RNA-binding Zn-ribbon protein involved in translation (DUF1610 family)
MASKKQPTYKIPKHREIPKKRKVGEKLIVTNNVNQDIWEMNAVGINDSAIAESLGVVRSTITKRRAFMGLEPNRKICSSCCPNCKYVSGIARTTHRTKTKYKCYRCGWQGNSLGKPDN